MKKDKEEKKTPQPLHLCGPTHLPTWEDDSFGAHISHDNFSFIRVIFLSSLFLGIVFLLSSD